MRKSRNKTGFRSMRAGIAMAATAAVVVAGSSLPAYAATYTLSPTQVAAGGGTVVYLSGGSAFNAPVVSATNYAGLAVRLIAPSSATCPTTYAGTSATANASVVSAGLAVETTASDAYFTTPAGLTHNTSYGVCLYATDATTNSGILDADPAFSTDTTVGTLTAVNMGAVSPNTGLANSKITLTTPTAVFASSGYTTQLVNNGTLTCPALYTTPTSLILAATTVKTTTSQLTITVPAGVVAGTQYAVCAYAGALGTSALVAKGSSTFANYGTTALPTVTLNPTGGSSGTTTAVTVTAATGIFTGSAPAALVTRNACPSTYAAGATGLEPYAPVVPPTKISTTKLAFSVPTSVVVGGLDATSPWNICLYASTSGALIAAPATYSVAPVLSVTNAMFATTGSPAATGSGPSQGGQTITISGLTGIPSAAAVADGAKLSATLGGSPITNITPVDSTSFTGTTSAHGAGDVQLSVTTAAGTKTTTARSAGGTKYYTYTYGITVTPNTAASGTTPVLDITGAGFSNITTWTDVTTAVAGAGAYVLLTDNVYYTQTLTNVTGFDAAKPPVSYCNGVLPISDVEIICTLNLTSRIDTATAGAPAMTGVDVPAGTYSVTVVNEGNDIDENEYSIVSSGSTFTVSPF